MDWMLDFWDPDSYDVRFLANKETFFLTGLQEALDELSKRSRIVDSVSEVVYRTQSLRRVEWFRIKHGLQRRLGNEI